MASNGIRVKNLAAFRRAVAAADKELRVDFRQALEESIEPVRKEAERLIVDEVTNISDRDPWRRMRSAVRTHVAYIAPVERGVQTRGRSQFRRPKLKPKALDEAMEPALVRKRRDVEHRFEEMIDDVLTVWSRG